MKITITADGRKLTSTTNGQPLTSGSVGIEATFVLSADYDGLAVTAVFSAGETQVDVVLTSPNCIVPWEVLQTAKETLFVGVVGKNGSGEIVIPTVWGRVGVIECGTVAEGIDPQDPTPDIAAQLLQIAQETVARAETAETTATEAAAAAGESATAAGEAKTDAETAAQDAETARQAIEDLSVEAHEDPDGPSVEKTVDPETGAVTLDFGIPPAPEVPVQSVNGKTGAVQLTIDDIPDGEIYARTTTAQVQQIGTNADDIEDIKAKIPTEASAQNQLADKAFVNDALSPYRTASDQDVIDEAQDDRLDDLEQTTTAATIGPAPIVTFDASAADMPLKQVLVDIEPVQSGSGDPSPENVRPITGWTGCKLLKTGQNLLYDIEYTNGTTAGVQYTKLSDGSYLATGTITGKSARYLIGGYWGRTFKPGKYQVSCDGVSSNGIRLILAYVQRYGQSVKYIDITTPNVKHAFEIEPTGYLYSAYFRGETTETQVNTVLKPLLLLQKNAGSEWEPVQYTTYPITFPTEAGTVYGGTLDVTNGVLTVDMAMVDLGSLAWSAVNETNDTSAGGLASTLKKPSSNSKAANMICSAYQVVARNNIAEKTILANTGGAVVVRDSSYAGMTGAQVASALSGVQLVYELATPIEITITPTEVTTLLGTNNIWADCGDVTVTYGAYLETLKASLDHTNGELDTLRACIAPIEDGATASQAYAAGAYFFRNRQFCTALTAISSGAAFTLGTNYQATTVAAALIALQS